MAGLVNKLAAAMEEVYYCYYYLHLKIAYSVSYKMKKAPRISRGFYDLSILFYYKQ